MKSSVTMPDRDVLAHALLYMSDGHSLELAIDDLRDYLAPQGSLGHILMADTLREQLPDLLLRYAKGCADEDTENAVSCFTRFQALWRDLLDAAFQSAVPTTQECIIITQHLEFLAAAETPSEMDDCFKELRGTLLRSDGSLLVDAKWQVEQHLTEMLIQALESLPCLPAEVSRAITLYHFLCDGGDTVCPKHKLSLLAVHHGTLCLLTPENVHRLNGRKDGKFLQREFDRLSRELPLFEFLALLGAINDTPHPDNTVADRVLENLCDEYQAMLAPMRG